MTILLFYIFKNLNFSSKHINKLISNMFAVFALENAVANVTAKIITYKELKFRDIGYPLITRNSFFDFSTLPNKVWV